MSKKILEAKRENVDAWYSKEAVDLANEIDGPGQRIGSTIASLHPKPPSLVHHYTTPSSLNAILKKPASLLLSHIHFTNDFTEYRHGYTVVKSELEAMLAAEKAPDRRVALECLRRRLEYTSEKTAVFIGCFSSGDDKLSQWRGYAPNGYAIGFDYSELLTAGHTRNIMLLPCSYDDQEHRHLSRTAIEVGIDTYLLVSASHPEPLAQQVAEIQFEVACTLVVPTMKPQSFAEEGEYRLVSPPYHVQHEPLAIIQQGRRLVPRYPFPLHTDDGKPLIRRVTIGPPPVDEDVKTGLLWSLVESGFEGAEIWESEVTYR